MRRPRLLSLLLRVVAHRLPRRFHTRGVRARLRVETLTDTERERLRRNLRAMLRPETA